MPSKRVAYALLSWPVHAVVYVVVPVLVSRIGERGDSPVELRVAGGVLVAAGAGIIGGAIVSHYRASPPEVTITAKPDYLATGGIYGRTRNPLYFGGGLLWCGWAALLGSLPVIAVAAVLFAGIALVGVPYEERILAATFGPAYDRYRTTVPRWIGPRRSK
jgi:protein-S-isoprenylcysteine O-methyltransferase Ste14